VEGLGINPTFLLSQIVNFLILFIALYFLLWKRVLKMLDARRQRIQEGLDRAEKAEEELARAQAARAEKVAEGEAEAERIKAAAKDGAVQASTQILESAREQAQKTLGEAQAQIDLERDQMLRDLRGQVAALALSAAHKIIGESLDTDRQRALVTEFFSGVRAGKIAVLDDVVGAPSLSAKPALVTSALPLDEREQASYREALVSRLGPDVGVSFRTDPAILGGVIVQVGDQVVDDSVAGKLETLRSRFAASQ